MSYCTSFIIPYKLLKDSIAQTTIRYSALMIEQLVDNIISIDGMCYDNILDFMAMITTFDDDLTYRLVIDADDMGPYYLLDIYLDGEFCGMSFQVDSEYISIKFMESE